MREVKLPTGVICKFDKKDNLISVISPYYKDVKNNSKEDYYKSFLFAVIGIILMTIICLIIY